MVACTLRGGGRQSLLIIDAAARVHITRRLRAISIKRSGSLGADSHSFVGELIVGPWVAYGAKEEAVLSEWFSAYATLGW